MERQAWTSVARLAAVDESRNTPRDCRTPSGSTTPFFHQAERQNP